MKKIRTILVDDELPAIDELSFLLSSQSDIEIISTANNASTAINDIIKLKPDLIFLDIQMPGKNGFEVLKEILGINPAPIIIFATAYDEYAIQAFEENAADYILKPVSKDRLNNSLDRARNILSKKEDTPNQMLQQLLENVAPKDNITRIVVEHSGRNILLSPNEVFYFTSENKKILATTQNGTYPLASDLTLDKIEDKLKSLSFFRANRSQIVNLSKVRSYAPWFNGKYIITMNNSQDSEITISKSRVKLFKEAVEL